MKEQLIQQFKDWCNDPKNEAARKHAVEYQFKRNMWVARSLDMCISIIDIHAIYYIFKVTKTSREKSIDITKEEYEHLKTIFLGDFEQDLDVYYASIGYSKMTKNN